MIDAKKKVQRKKVDIVWLNFCKTSCMNLEVIKRKKCTYCPILSFINYVGVEKIDV